MARAPAEGTFELGLVMAGAVSGGAYAAGVIDFVFEALTAWEAARKADPDAPDHRVEIRVSAGTSAGGIGAALVAMLPFTGHAPVNDLTTIGAKPLNADRNLLYRSWVTAVDIRKMLGTSDLEGGRAASLLDGGAVAAIADDAVATVRDAIKAGPPKGMPFVANPLQLFLCLTNLRGLPYSVQMTAMGGVRGHRVFCHSDYGHFCVLGTNARRAEMLSVGSTPVNWPGTAGTSHDGWSRLRDAALATSAFPLGLPARKFENEGVVYQSKAWPRPAGAALDAPVATVAPDLAPHVQAPFQFWCVDGGVLNNEPVEFARIALAGAPDARNPRDPDKADRAILMIDPFPDEAEALADFGDEPDLLAVPFALIPAMKMHARFKPEEVMLALDESVFSRFLVAPWRDDCKAGETHLAANGLAGFAAFFHQDLRQHDFQLGRRNAQKFLRDHLVVHVDNKIVKPWVDRLKGKIDQYHPRIAGTSRPNTNYVQLIPLIGTVATREEKALPWPKLDWKTDVAPLHAAIEERAEKLVELFMTRLLGVIGLKPGGALNELFGWIGKEALDDKIATAAMEKIKADLSARGLV